MANIATLNFLLFTCWIFGCPVTYYCTAFAYIGTFHLVFEANVSYFPELSTFWNSKNCCMVHNFFDFSVNTVPNWVNWSPLCYYLVPLCCQIQLLYRNGPAIKLFKSKFQKCSLGTIFTLIDSTFFCWELFEVAKSAIYPFCKSMKLLQPTVFSFLTIYHFWSFQ